MMMMIETVEVMKGRRRLYPNQRRAIEEMNRMRNVQHCGRVMLLSIGCGGGKPEKALTSVLLTPENSVTLFIVPYRR